MQQHSIVIYLLIVSTVSTVLFAEPENKALRITGADYHKPYTAYMNIQKAIGKTVAKGRVEFYQKQLKNFEGIHDFCVQFDLTANKQELNALRNDLLEVSGVSEVDGVNAYIGKLTLVETCF